jgi:flavoprotein
MTVDLILSLLQKVKRTGPGKWIARCPAHNDRTPSLAIKDDDGVILMHCFGCGASGVEVCEAIGVDVSELFPEKLDDYESQEIAHFHPSQVLEAIQTEALIIYMIADSMAKKERINEQEKAQLLLSVSRVQAANNYLDKK